jgi:hypothetical protein
MKSVVSELSLGIIDFALSVLHWCQHACQAWDIVLTPYSLHTLRLAFYACSQKMLSWRVAIGTKG